MRTFKKNSLLVLLAFVIAISLGLVACSSSSDNSSGSSNGGSSVNENTSGGDSSNGVLVELYMDKSDWVDNMDLIGSDALENHGTGFVTVAYPDTTSYQTTVRQGLQGNDPPDLMTWWSGFRMEDLVRSGAIAELTEEWNQYEQEGLNPDLAGAFTLDGKIYGAPLNVAYWNVFYNVHVFEELGLEEPDTWDEFIQVMDTMKENGITPLANPFEGRWPTFIWFEEFLINTDPDFYERLVLGEASYTDPEAVEAMEIWKWMIDEGYFSEPGSIDSDLLSGFAQGNIGMTLVGDWYQAPLTSSGLTPGEDYNAFILPSINPDIGSVAIYETAPILVAENGRNKEDALKALHNFFKQDIQQQYIDLQSFSPMTAGVVSENPVTSNVNRIMDEKQTRLIQRYWEATPPDISEFAVDELSRFVLDPETYMDVLQSIEDHASNYWANR